MAWVSRAATPAQTRIASRSGSLPSFRRFRRYPARTERNRRKPGAAAAGNTGPSGNRPRRRASATRYGGARMAAQCLRTNCAGFRWRMGGGILSPWYDDDFLPVLDESELARFLLDDRRVAPQVVHFPFQAGVLQPQFLHLGLQLALLGKEPPGADDPHVPEQGDEQPRRHEPGDKEEGKAALPASVVFPGFRHHRVILSEISAGWFLSLPFPRNSPQRSRCCPRNRSLPRHPPLRRRSRRQPMRRPPRARNYCTRGSSALRFGPGASRPKATAPPPTSPRRPRRVCRGQAPSRRSGRRRRRPEAPRRAWRGEHPPFPLSPER